MSGNCQSDGVQEFGLELVNTAVECSTLLKVYFSICLDDINALHCKVFRLM